VGSEKEKRERGGWELREKTRPRRSKRGTTGSETRILGVEG